MAPSSTTVAASLGHYDGTTETAQTRRQPLRLVAVVFAIALLVAAAAFTGLVATQVVTQDVSLRASGYAWQRHKQQPRKQQPRKQQEEVPSFGAPTSSGNIRSSTRSSIQRKPPTERVPARAPREAAAATLASSSTSVGGTNSRPPTVHVPSRARSEAAAITLASNKIGGGPQRRPSTLLVPPRATSEAAALTIASNSVAPSTPRRHPTLPAPFRATSAAAVTTTNRHPHVTGSTPRRPATLPVSARSRATSEATAATTTSTPSVTGSSSISQDSAASDHTPVLRPDYAARVTEALASVREWAKLSPPRAVTAALADFLGVKDVHEWPKGGFLPGYASPCWKSVREGAEVLCLPRFRLLGVCKSGTTTLSTHISRHPESVPLAEGSRYELQMFNLPSDLPATVEDFARSPRSYAWSQGAARQPELMFGDGDPVLYLLNRGKWQLGKGNTPLTHKLRSGPSGTVNRAQFVRALDVKANTYGAYPVKYLIIVRDPVKRAFSHFRFYQVRTTALTLTQRAEDFEPTADYFHTYIEEAVTRFQDCLFSQPVELAITACISTHKFTQEMIIGLYYVHLRQWLTLSKTKLHRDVLVTRLEDIGGQDAAAGQELNRIFGFLGLRKLQPEEMEAHLTNSDVVNVQHGIKEQVGAMKEETQALLKAVFAPFNAALAAAVGNPKLAYE